MSDFSARPESPTGDMSRLESCGNLLRTVLDTAPLAVVMLDREERVQLWNRAAESLFGWTAEEVVGYPLPTIAQHRHEFRHYQNELRSGRPLENFETQRLRKDGTLVEVSLSNAVVRNASGEVEGFIAVFQDISERKHREAQLLEVAKGVSAATGETFFRSLVEHLAQALGVDYALVGEITPACDGVNTLAFWGPDGIAPNFSYVLEGTPCAKVIGRHFCIFPTQVIDRFPRDASLRSMRIEGYAGVPLFDSSHEPLGIIVVLHRQALQDPAEVESLLTIFASRAATEIERLTAERAIRESEERYRQLVKLAPLAIAVHRAGKFIFANEEACRQLGAGDQSDLIGRTALDIVHPDDRPMVAARIARMLEQGARVPPLVERFVGLDGRQFEAEVMAAPLLIQGQPAVLVISQDVTERKRTEETLRHAQKMESIGVLAGGVAHDFNNLLNGILGQCALALDGVPNGSESHRHIERAVQAAERAADLTRQLLAYAGRGQFDVRLVDVNELLRQNAHLFRVSIPRNVELLCAQTEDALWVKADVGHLQQVVMNLILNAAEAIGERSGTVSLRTSARRLTGHEPEFSRHTAEPLPPGTYIALEVEDNGCGMDEETLSRIFDPFFTTKFSGRGLGLAAVLGIVKRHKGGLAVSSAPGSGTLFTVVFPQAQGADVRPTSGGSKDAPSPKEPPPARETAAAPTRLVLVIDDEPVVRQVTRDILKRAGLGAITADNGETGLRLYNERREEIGLVLLDLSMPTMGGEETFRELLAIDPTVKVVLSSGFAEDEVSRRFEGMGLAGFIQKPYLPKKLVTMVREMMD